MAISVSDYMVEQSPQISVDINQKLMEQPTPWITLYPQETWQDQKSNTQKTFQFDRALIASDADEVEWADISSDIDGNYQTAADTTGGLPPADDIIFSETLREYNLQHKAIWGPPLNTNKLRDKFIRVQQMNAQVKALSDQAREFWIERKRSEYTRVADNLVVLDSNFALGGGDYGKMNFGSYSGTDGSILTNGFTDFIYEFMNQQGAAQGALGSAGGRPVYGLVTSARQSRRLVMADPDVREDFRYSSQNENLLAPMGIKWTYNGFTHIIDDLPPRWNWVAEASAYVTVADPVSSAVDAILMVSATPTAPNAAGFRKGSVIYSAAQIAGGYSTGYVVTKKINATTCYVKLTTGAAASVVTATTAGHAVWVKVPPYIVSSSKRIPNSAWLTAVWEDSYIFHQKVCTSLVPAPISSVGQAQFKAIDYSGSFRWTMYPDKTNNPDEQIGQFRGVLSNGTRPDNPEFGIVIRHLAVPTPDGRVVDGSALG
jgi:hypothetical protein